MMRTRIFFAMTLLATTGMAQWTNLNSGAEVPNGMPEATNENGLLLFPNPSNGDVNIAVDGASLQGPLTIEVRTADGRIVDRATTERMTRPARMFGMPPGQYVVIVSDGVGASLRSNLIVQANF